MIRSEKSRSRKARKSGVVRWVMECDVCRFKPSNEPPHTKEAYLKKAHRNGWLLSHVGIVHSVVVEEFVSLGHGDFDIREIEHVERLHHVCPQCKEILFKQMLGSEA